MNSLKITTLTTLLLLSSCSNFQNERKLASVDTPKSKSCFKNVDFFIIERYNSKVQKALEEKKLVHKNTDKLIIRAPGKFYLKRLVDRANNFYRKVINDNRHPSYYMFNEEDSLSNILVYVRALAKDQKSMGAIDTVEPIIESWVEDYKNYNDQLKDMIQTRVVLQFNIDALEVYKRDAFDFDQVTLRFWKRGKWEKTTFTFRKDDDNLSQLIKDLKNSLKRMDGGFFTPDEARKNERISFGSIDEGQIRTRVIKQAELRDKLTMLHRELEFAYNNLENRNEFSAIDDEGKEKLTALYKEISLLLHDDSLAPSNFAENKISTKKFFAELKKSARTKKYYDKIIEKSELIEEYMNKKDLSRSKLLSRGYGWHARMTYFATTGGISLGGLVTMFDIDDKVAEYWEKILVMWYGEKIQCVKEKPTDDKKFFQCLWKHYKADYPDIVTLAIKNPKFNPFDISQVQKNNHIPSPIKQAYIEDLKDIMKLREQFKLIYGREKEIERLFIASHQNIGEDIDLDDLQECVVVSTNKLPLCIYDNVLKPLLGKSDAGFLQDRRANEFKVEDFEKIPQEVRGEYQKAVQKILDERALIKDLQSLDERTIRMLFDDL